MIALISQALDSRMPVGAGGPIGFSITGGEPPRQDKAPAGIFCGEYRTVPI